MKRILKMKTSSITISLILVYLLSIGTSFADNTDYVSCDTASISRISASASDFIDGIIPPSPSVSAVCKYGDIPVGYSTGTVDVSIPLYTLKCGELELPITLSYHGGGIKVDENASFVGLGWSLNAGGCIGVTVVGGTDSFMGSNYSIPPYQDMRQTYPQPCPYDVGELGAMSRMDLQPDIHSYNFYNYSGQFVFDNQDRKFYDISGKKNLVWHTYNDKSYIHSKLAATDNKGNNFLFAETESCLSSCMGRTRNETTAWYLTEIKSFNGYDSISIDYGGKSYMEYEHIRKATSQVFGINNEDWETGVMVNGEKKIMLGSPYPEISEERDYRTKKVQKIMASNNTSIVFEYSENREDMKAQNKLSKAVSLTSMTVFDMDGKRIKKWKFNYDYFRSPISNDEDETANCRLKLESVTEYGSDDDTSQTYSFNYYGEEAGEPQMPYKYSYSGKDKWGYCNGSPNIFDAKDWHKAFPNFSDFFFNRLKLRKDYWSEFYIMKKKYQKSMHVSYTQGESKESDENYAIACSLKKITYPTGGYSRFVYELNHYGTCDNIKEEDGGSYLVSEYGPGIRIKEICNSADGANETRRWLGYSEGELMCSPHFVKRKTYQYDSFVPYEIYNPGTNTISHYEDHSESPEIITYVEMYSSPCNVSSIGGANNIGYTTVTEHMPDGSSKVYDFASLSLDFDNDNMIEKGTPFAGYNCFLGIYTDELEFPLYCYFDGETGIEYETYRNIEDQSFAVSYSCMNQITSDRDSDYDGFCGTFWHRGKPLRERIYDASGNLVDKTEYSYDVSVSHLVPSMSVTAHFNWHGFHNPAYSFCVSHIVSGESKLAEKTHTRYTNGNNDSENSIKEKTYYSFNDNGLLRQTTYIDSKGDTITEKVTYPDDIKGDAVYIQMSSMNMLDYPVEKSMYNNSRLTNSTLTTYKESGKSFFPYEFYSYTPKTPDENFKSFNGIVSQKYSSPELVISEYSYGRICSYALKDGTVKSYLWGYNSEYPILEAIGIPYSEFIWKLKSNGMSEIYSFTDKNISDVFRIFDNAMINVYTYQPSVGMMKSVNSSGMIKEYMYDSFGRLGSVYRGALTKPLELQEKYQYNITNK